MNLQLWHIALTAIVLLFLGGLVGRWVAVLWSVVQTSRIAGQGVSTLLEEAAEQMIADPPQQWVAWCLHLLKAIEIRVDGQAYRTALAEIQADIRVRLETGRWPGRQVQADAEQGAKE